MSESHESQVFEDSSPRSTKAEARHKRRAEKKASSGPKPLEAKTPRQAQLISSLRSGRAAFAIGGAGTGKTYIPSRIAAQRLLAGDVEKIIVCRPTASDSRHAQGFLPGKLDAKLAPWLVPVIDGLRAEVSGAVLDQWKADGRFEIASFEHMRGRTFAGAFVILDEAQNCSFKDLRMFLTRIGEGAQTVVTGDIDQIDIHDSGLATIVEIIEDDDVLDEMIDVIEFTDEDVVRSPFAKAFVRAFSRWADRRTDVNLDKPPAFLQRADHR